MSLAQGGGFRLSSRAILAQSDPDQWRGSNKDSAFWRGVHQGGHLSSESSSKGFENLYTFCLPPVLSFAVWFLIINSFVDCRRNLARGRPGVGLGWGRRSVKHEFYVTGTEEGARWGPPPSVRLASPL